MNMADRLVGLIKKYYNTIDSFISFITYPVAMFVANYSLVAGESIKNIKNIFVNIIALLPIFLISISISILFQGQPVYENIGIEQEFLFDFIAIVLLLSTGISIYLSHSVLKDNLKNTLYISILLLVGSIFTYALKTPEVYVVLIATIYGIGGYTVTKIKFQNPIPHAHIYDDIEPHKHILKISVISGIFIIISLVIIQNTNITSIIPISMLYLILGAVAYTSSVIQKPSYNIIYKNVGFNDVKSSFWILTPRIITILGTGILLVSNSPYMLASFLSTSIFGILFYAYIQGKATKLSGYRYILDSDGHFNPSVTPPISELSINKISIDDESDSTQFSADISFNIKDRYPYSIEQWIEVIGIIKGILKSAQMMDSTNKEYMEIRNYYDKLIDKIVEEEDDDILEILPDDIREDFVSRMAENNRLDNQDIYDIEISEKIPEQMSCDAEYSN